MTLDRGGVRHGGSIFDGHEEVEPAVATVGRSALSSGGTTSYDAGEAVSYFDRAVGEATAAITRLAWARSSTDRAQAVTSAAGIARALGAARVHGRAALVAADPERQARLAALELAAARALVAWRSSRAELAVIEQVLDPPSADARSAVLPHQRLDPRASALRIARSGVTGAGEAGCSPPEYINRHGSQVLAALHERLWKKTVPDPHPRLRWVSALGIGAEIARAIQVFVEHARDQILKQLMELSQPADLFALVGDLLRRPGFTGWRPEIGAAIAAAFDHPIYASVLRMGMRARARMDVQTDMPSVASLVVSCPLDRVIAELLVSPRFVVRNAKQQRGTDDTPAHTFEHGLRHVTFEWQGTRDPALWNWIRVKSPSDATAEEVAHIPFGGGEVLSSEQAYRIAVNAPYFGIPIETARRVPDALQHAPFDIQRQLARGDLGPRYADPAALGDSAVVSDEAALAQAPLATKDDLPADRAIERIRAQLAFAARELQPWGASRQLGPAQRFIARRESELAKDPRQAQSWRASLAAHERALYAIVSEIAEVLGDLRARGVTAASATALGPVVGVLEAYARAAGTSHLAGAVPQALADARRLRVVLPLAIAEDRIRIARDAVAEQQHSQVKSNVVEPGARSTIAAVPELAERGADLRLAALRGEMDIELIDELGADADLTALRARIITLQTQVHAVERRADAVGITDKPFQHGLPTLRAFALALRRDSAAWLVHLDDRNLTLGPAEGRGSERHRRTERKRRATKDVERQLARFKDLGGIGQADNYFTWAARQIADKELRDILNAIALQLGVMIATGQLAGAAFAALRGMSVGAEVVSGIRAAGTLFKAGEIVVQAGVATGMQAVTSGHAGSHAMAENLLASVLASAAMRPFRGLFQHANELEQEVVTFASAAMRGGHFVAELALDSATSIAASATARILAHGGGFNATNTDEWISQAVAFAASRFVNRQVAKVRERLKSAAEIERDVARESRMKLAQLAYSIEQQSRVAKRPTAEESLEMVARYHELLRGERALYQQRVARDPSEAERLHAANADLAALGSAGELPLHLARLSPVVEGHVYEGTPAAIRTALDAATTMGIDVRPEHDLTTQSWRLTVGDRTIEIRKLEPHGERAKVPDAGPVIHEHAPQPSRMSLAVRKRALEELATIPVATASDVGVTSAPRDAYYVTRADGDRMRDLLGILGPDVQVRSYEKGLLVRRGRDEWYFEYHEASQASPVQHGRVPRARVGLPAPNVATVELWGFRGVRTIHGRTQEHWTDAERAYVAKERKKQPLMWAGHIGISTDGGRTIIGFTPKANPSNMDEVMQGLLRNDAYPGLVADDTPVFERARRNAEQHGWNTDLVHVVELVDKPKKRDVVDRLAGMMSGRHDLGYAFPMRQAENGSHFRDSNGFSRENIRNCATFPNTVGLPIPESTGLLGAYMPALQKWAADGQPVDARDKAK